MGHHLDILLTFTLISMRVRPNSLIVGRTRNGRFTPSVIRYLEQNMSVKIKPKDETTISKIITKTTSINGDLKITSSIQIHHLVARS